MRWFKDDRKMDSGFNKIQGDCLFVTGHPSEVKPLPKIPLFLEKSRSAKNDTVPYFTACIEDFMNMERTGPRSSRKFSPNCSTPAPRSGKSRPVFSRNGS